MSSECKHLWHQPTCMFCKLELERDEARAKLQEVDDERIHQWGLAEQRKVWMVKLRDALEGVLDAHGEIDGGGGKMIRCACEACGVSREVLREQPSERP